MMELLWWQEFLFDTPYTEIKKSLVALEDEVKQSSIPKMTYIPSSTEEYQRLKEWYEEALQFTEMLNNQRKLQLEMHNIYLRSFESLSESDIDLLIQNWSQYENLVHEDKEEAALVESSFEKLKKENLFVSSVESIGDSQNHYWTLWMYEAWWIVSSDLVYYYEKSGLNLPSIQTYHVVFRNNLPWPYNPIYDKKNYIVYESLSLPPVPIPPVKDDVMPIKKSQKTHPVVLTAPVVVWKQDDDIPKKLSAKELERVWTRMKWIRVERDTNKNFVEARDADWFIISKDIFDAIKQYIKNDLDGFRDWKRFKENTLKEVDGEYHWKDGVWFPNEIPE